MFQPFEEHLRGYRNISSSIGFGREVDMISIEQCVLACLVNYEYDFEGYDLACMEDCWLRV